MSHNYVQHESYGVNARDNSQINNMLVHLDVIIARPSDENPLWLMRVRV